MKLHVEYVLKYLVVWNVPQLRWKWQNKDERIFLTILFEIFG